jgi:ligand-binding SRPBCC domain-containing protein
VTELERRQVVSRPLAATFAFFADPRNLELVTPPWLRFRIDAAPRELHEGARIRYRLRLFGIPLEWEAEIVQWQPPRTFVDRQARGPYRLWTHTHRFAAVGDETEVYDHVLYRVPGGPVGPRRLVRRWLDEIFDYRAARLAELLAPPQGAGRRTDVDGDEAALHGRNRRRR